MSKEFEDWKHNNRMMELCKKHNCKPSELINSYIDENCKALRCYDIELN